MNEQVWLESADTAKGRLEHQRVHTERKECRGDQIKLYEYSVFSDVLGISGKCDCIEAQRDENGCIIPAADFPVSLYPIEYKHGTVREEQEYFIQLCAQALCLEEMYHTTIKQGAIFYISSHKRMSVDFTPELRNLVAETSEKLRRVRDNLWIPPAAYTPKCKRCSLKEYCLPNTRKSAREYCARLEEEALGVIDLDENGGIQ